MKNPNYWRKDSFGQQLPYLDQITFKPVPDPTAMLNGLKSKAVRPREHRRHHHGDPAARCRRSRASRSTWRSRPRNPEIAYTIFNTSKVPFNNILARQAFAYAYDKTLYNKLRQDDLNEVADGPFGPGVLGYLADSGLPSYNLDDGASRW